MATKQNVTWDPTLNYRLLQQAYGNIPNWQTYGAKQWGGLATPDWQSMVSQIPDWRAMGQQVQQTYNAANQVGLEDERMQRESGQLAGLSNRGVLQPGFNPLRYWYAQRQAENNAAGLQARLGVESGLRGEALSTGAGLRSEALNQLLHRYGIESGLRGEAAGGLSAERAYELALQALASQKSAQKSDFWSKIFGGLGTAAGLLLGR